MSSVNWISIDHVRVKVVFVVVVVVIFIVIVIVIIIIIVVVVVGYSVCNSLSTFRVCKKKTFVEPIPHVYVIPVQNHLTSITKNFVLKIMRYNRKTVLVFFSRPSISQLTAVLC